MCEPLRDYEVVLDKGAGAKAASLLTGGLVNEGVSAKISQFVKRIKKEAEENGQEIDAVVYDSGKRTVGVKWKEAATEKNKGIGRASKVNGLYVFVTSEPLSDYDDLIDKSGGAKAKSLLTGGLANNSIAQDIAQFVKRIKKEAEESGQEIDAVVYSTGKRAIGVKFK